MKFDRFVYITTLIAASFMLGQINAPEPKVLPCAKKQSLDMSKQAQARFITYWKGQSNVVR